MYIEKVPVCGSWELLSVGPLLQFTCPFVLKWFCLALSCPQSKSAVDATKDVASGFKRVFGKLGVGARISAFFFPRSCLVYAEYAAVSQIHVQPAA